MYIFSIFPFLQGINQLHIVFILDVLMCGVLLYKIHVNKQLIIPKDIKFTAILIWCFCYLLTVFTAVDGKFAFLGFLKFLTVPLFLILLGQYKLDEKKRDKLFYMIPKIGAIMMAIILLALLIGQAGIFFNENRLAGFFTYANSFAMFLLIGIVIMGFRSELKWYDYAINILLTIGIILTNSRSMMIIFAFAYLLVIIFSKKNRKQNLITAIILFAFAIVTNIVMNKFGVSNRLSTTSAGASEWVLRLLYYKDAIKMFKQNLLGYGYMAWSYMQESFQTGAYDARFLHNALLQVIFDAGVIAGVMIIFVFIKGFFEKSTTARDRILMIIILGHSLIDFDIEFLAITLVLFATLHFKEEYAVKQKALINSTVGICIAVYSYFSIAMIAIEMGDYHFANSMYPYSVSLNSEFATTNNYQNKLKLAEELYKENKYFTENLYFLSDHYQQLGDYDKALIYEKQAVSNKKYTMMNYIEYTSFLSDAIRYYRSGGDSEKMSSYIEEVLNVETMIDDVLENSDELAFKIEHKPRLDMPEEMKEYIEQMKKYRL